MVEQELCQQLHNYSEIREKIYSRIPEFNWKDEYLNSEVKEYALGSVHLVEEYFIEEIRKATNELGNIFDKVVNVLRIADDNTLLELGIHKDLLNIVRHSPFNISTLIGRFDFASVNGKIKILEFNADTPCSILEAFLANRVVLDYFRVKDPNKSTYGDIKLLFKHAIKTYAQENYPINNIVFSSLENYKEDKGTTEFLLKESGLKAKYVPLKDLRICSVNNENYLYALINGTLEKVDVLYRLHPLDNFVNDLDGNYKTGIECLNLFLNKKLALINPPTSLIAQVKSLQTLIWGLHENNQFFSEEEHNTIEKYMLPTYLEKVFKKDEIYVQKAILGREGASVSIIKNDKIIEKDRHDNFSNQKMVYQKYVEMDSTTVETKDGFKTGKILWGSFYIGGKASAITARLGGKITNVDALFLPIGIK